MAREQIISIKTGEAVKNIAQLRENIKLLKEQLNDSEQSWEDQQKVLRELSENQAALRNAMHGTAASMEEVQKAAVGLTTDFSNYNKVIEDTGDLLKDESVSYNEYVRVLAQLKEAWRSTTDATERQKLGEAINAVNDKLKGLDETVGVFGRNVGNYIGAVDHLIGGLSSMGSGAAGLVAPVKAATGALKTFSATPAVAILGVLATVLDQVMKAMKGNEEQTQQLTAAMAPFQAIGDLLTKTLQAVAGVVVKLIEGFSNLAQAIFGSNKATEQRIALAKQEAELAKQARDTTIKNAEAERDVAELRAKSTDRLNYTAKERLAFLEQAGDKEKEIAARALQDAKLQYEIIKAKNALSKSSARDLDAEAQAYAAMVKAETDYYNQVRTINAGIVRTRREEAKAARDAAKAVKDAATAKINAEKDYLTQLLGMVKKGTESQFKIQNTIAKKEYELAVANAKQKITDEKELARTLETLQKAFLLKLQKNQQEHDAAVQEQTLLAIANRRDALQQGSVEYAEAQKAYAEAALAGLRQQMDETDAEFKARTIAAQRSLAEAANGLADAVAKETADGLKAQMEGLREGSVEQLQVALELAKHNLESIYQGIDESLDEFNARRLAAAKAVAEAEDELAEAQIDRDRVILEQRMAGLEEGSIQYLTYALELKQLELDTLHQFEGESNEAFRLRQLKAEKDYANARRAIWESSLSIMQQAASGISSIMGTIADAYENNTEMTKEEAEKAKNLRIAGATIDMLSGAVAAYSGAQSLGVPMGPIIGAINAAAVVATGIANIAKIKATQISTGSSGSSTEASIPAAVSAPTLEPEVQQVRTITSASEEDRLNQMASDQRVYILDSDIQASNEARQVRVAETTF